MGPKLDDARRQQIIRAVQGFFQDEFDESLSDYRAEALVDFMLAQIGPSQYNQAIGDARKFMQEKLDQLDTDFHQPEEL